MTMSNRTFGVEIECYGRRRVLLHEFLRASGLSVAEEGYSFSQWVIKGDPTIRPGNDLSLVSTTDRHGGTRGRCQDTYGNNLDHPVELCSPILRGEDGIAELRKAVKVLTRLGFRVNPSCGLHIHIGAEELSVSSLYSLLKRYADNETQIDAFMDPTRQGGNSCFCRSALPGLANIEANRRNRVEDVQVLDEDYDDGCDCGECRPGALTNNPFGSVNDFSRYAGGRNTKVNTRSLQRIGTVEFRGHHGSVTVNEIDPWIRFLVNFVETSKSLAPIRDQTGNIIGDAEIAEDEGIYMGLDMASVQSLEARPGCIILGETITPAV